MKRIQIVSQRSGEEKWCLRQDSERVAKTMKANRLRVSIVNLDPSGCRFRESEEQRN